MRPVNFNFLDFKKTVRESADIRSADKPILDFINASTTVTLNTNLRTRTITNTHGQVTRLAQLLWQAEKFNFARDLTDKTNIEALLHTTKLGLFDIFSLQDKPTFKLVHRRVFKSEWCRNIDIEDDSFHWTRDMRDRFHFHHYNTESDKIHYLLYMALERTFHSLLPDPSDDAIFACSQFAHLFDVPVPATGQVFDIREVREALITLRDLHKRLLEVVKHYTDKQTAERSKSKLPKPGEKFTDTEKKLDTAKTILSGCELLEAQYVVLAQQLIAAYHAAEEASDTTLPRIISFTHFSMQRLLTARTLAECCDDGFVRGMLVTLHDMIDNLALRASLAEAGTGGAAASADSGETKVDGDEAVDTDAVAGIAPAMVRLSFYAAPPAAPQPAVAGAGLLADADEDEVDTRILVPASRGGT
ncbi:MAG: hypothetical protein P1U63_04765 [Coxiellaceae bacterium]|nr:hypothetical protein [Coxiellaceae bacterium]